MIRKLIAAWYRRRVAARQAWDPCCDYCQGVDTLRAVKLPRGRVAACCPPCLNEVVRACPAARILGVIG